MAVKDSKKYFELAKCLNTTFGDSATNRSHTLNQSIKLDLKNETTMMVRFMMVVNFGSDNMVREMSQRFKNEGLTMIEAALKRVAKEYEANTGEKVKLRMVEGTLTDTYEFLSYSMYNPKKTAYFRLTCLVDIQ